VSNGSANRDPLHQELIDLCFDRGLESVGVPDLCRRAGMDPADFESRYGTLEDCFYEAYAAEFARYRRQAAAAREGLTEWRSRLRATAYALLRFLAEDERVTHFTVVEVRRAGERSALLIGEGIEELIDLLDEGRLEPGAPSDLTRATAESVAGGLFNQLYLAVAGGGPAPVESEVVPQAMYSAVLPYLGVQAAMEELSIAPPAQLAAMPDPRPSVDRALIELCHERGFADVTIPDLCRRAGIEEADFHDEYADLDDCFCAVFERELDLLLIDFAAVVSGAAGWRSRLRAVAYAFQEWLAADPARTHMMVNEIRSASERARQIQWRGIASMIDLLDEGRAETAHPDRLSRATAEGIAGGILSQIYEAAAHRVEIRPASVPEMLYAAYLPYLGPEVAAEELEIAPPSSADR
jgi:AcrR family transcriptional regulator